MLTHINKVLSIKEPRSLTDLLKISVAESLLDYYINQALVNWILIVAELTWKVHSRQCGLFNEDRVIYTLKANIYAEIFIELR